MESKHYWWLFNRKFGDEAINLVINKWQPKTNLGRIYSNSFEFRFFEFEAMNSNYRICENSVTFLNLNFEFNIKFERIESKLNKFEFI